MQCKYEKCDNEAQGNSEYCSKSCRAQHSRRNKSSATSEAQHSFVIADGKVYYRQAVRFDVTEAWETRPLPLNDTDQPVLNNRGRYKRADSTVYQFDACGKSFECTHKYEHQRYDHEPKHHMGIYKTAGEVRQVMSV